MSRQNIEKEQFRIYAPSDLIDHFKSIASELDIPTSKLGEIIIYYVTHCTPSERAAIIAKYFDPAWPPKED
ncbi:MAG: hypothetical protein AB1656_04915 [Candidatus Omnitrophota bacterium]